MARRRTKGSGSLRKRGNVWWLTYYAAGRPIAESSHGDDKEAANNLLKQRLGELAAGEDVARGKATIADLCELVLADYRLRNLRDLKTVEWRYKANIKPAIGSVLASKFGPAQVRTYVESRRAHEASDATINRELAIVRRGFALGHQEDPPLVRRVPHIPKLEEDNARQGFVEHAQYVALRAAMPDHLKAVLVVGYHCGNRLGELRKLKWPQVDMEAGEIRIQRSQAKGKKPRTLPIYGDMREWLEWQQQRKNGDLVFHWQGKPLGSHLKGWERACEQAGVPGLHFHDLRRSAIRNMERAGIPRHVAMGFSGHKTESTYRRYDIVVNDDLKAATEKLEQYQRAQQQPKLKRVK